MQPHTRNVSGEFQRVPEIVLLPPLKTRIRNLSCEGQSRGFLTPRNTLYVEERALLALNLISSVRGEEGENGPNIPLQEKYHGGFSRASKIFLTPFKTTVRNVAWEGQNRAIPAS